MNELPTAAREVLTTWFGSDTGEEPSALHQRRWFVRDATFDAELSQRFQHLLANPETEAPEWEASAFGALARVIVLDQLPRNLFRDDPRAFATDPLARAAADRALARGFDREVPLLHASFFYLPFEHSESLADQDRAVALFRALADRAAAHETAVAANLVTFAEKHQAIVARFGRFPHRNAVLGRASTAEEEEFLQSGRGF